MTRNESFQVIESGLRKEGLFEEKEAKLNRAKQVFCDKMAEITANIWKEKYPEL